MPRPKTEPHYQYQVASYAEQGFRVPAIARLIREDAISQGRTDAPSERTVRRLYQEHIGKSHEDRGEFAQFFWPESMEDAELPWEASSSVLGMLQTELKTGKRPEVWYVKCWWRVYLAAPDLAYVEQRVAAQELGLKSLDQEHALRTVRAVETYLAYAPWRAADEEELKTVLISLCKANHISEEYSRPPYMFFGHNWQPSLATFLMLTEEANGDADTLGMTESLRRQQHIVNMHEGQRQTDS